MQSDTSAFLLLVEDVESEVVIDKMKGFNANVVTLTVGDELSGEIAQVAAGEATESAPADDDSEAASDDSDGDK